MSQILFLNPVFKENIWGGDQLKTRFGYDIPSDHTGECWAVSAHKNGCCTVRGGEFHDRTLASLWETNRELFGNLPMEEFPLLIKIIDAKEDLSIQVHPDDSYAKANEHGSLGKTECWYVLDCAQDASIVVGHNAETREALLKMAEQNRWMELVKTRPLRKGDFFQIPPGTIHAIKGKTLILEVQQSSDITYRLYDYDRLWNGQPRELHIKKGLDVIKVPYAEENQPRRKLSGVGCEREELVSCPAFHVEKVTVSGKTVLDQQVPFLIANVLGGHGTIDGQPVRKGDNMILTAGCGRLFIEGQLQMIFTSVPQNEEEQAQTV